MSQPPSPHFTGRWSRSQWRRGEGTEGLSLLAKLGGLEEYGAGRWALKRREEGW